MDMTYEDFLEHYGTKGQKWGVRKYQNPDGSLTAAGRVHYGVGKARDAAVTAVKKVAKATGQVAKKVAVATGHGVAKAGSATAHKVGEIHDKRKAKKREQKIREWATDLEELNKHQTELTDDEYREALSRANMNRQLSDLKKAELDRGLSYIKSAAEATGNTLTLANNVSKMITGKSFEDLRKPETEMDKLKLAKERLINESQAAITATNQSKQREQENKENAAKAKSEFDLRRMREATEADRWKEKDAAEVAKREYQQHKEQRAAIDEAMRQVKEHDAQVAANRKAAAEKAAETRAANEYRKEMRATPEYKTIFNRLDKAYTNTMEDYYQKQGDSAAEAKKKAKEYVERLADKWLDDDLALSAFDDPNYLEHHGVKGQRWGVRRYQNLDGSLTEEGKMHRLKYITSETEKNNAYYSKYEKKYQKLADKAKSDEERAQYLAMKADATKSKNQVNEYLKNMSFDQILANEKESRDKAVKTASTVAKVGLMGISMAGGVAGVAAGVRAGVAGASMAVTFLSNPDNQTMLVNNAMKYAEMGIRAVVDVKQWATGVAIDEMASNIGKYTNPDDFRVVGEAAGKIVRSVSEGFSSQTGDAVSKATEKVTEAAVRGATSAIESHGGDAGSAALQVAAELARETAGTSEAISGDVATTAENVNDIVNMITSAADKVKHSADQDPNFLAHHGIKGQRWGVRRFQNYDGTRIGAAKAVTYDPKNDPDPHHANDNETEKKAQLIKSAAMSAGLIVAGSAYTAAMLSMGYIDPRGVLVAATGVSGLAASGISLAQVGMAKIKEDNVEKERAANTNVDKKTGLRLKNSDMTEKEDLKRVNPGFNNWNTNTKSNCMLCTTAYDMRRRGYDVKAKTASAGYAYEDLNTWYPKAHIMKVEHKNTILDEMGYTHTLTRDTKKILAAQGDGARGNIMVHWSSDLGGGGHSMVYEVKKGKVIIRCPQSNKTWNDASILNNCVDVAYARLDNVDFDPKKIKEAVE